jgi:hypothetical protein
MAQTALRHCCAINVKVMAQAGDGAEFLAHKRRIPLLSAGTIQPYRLTRLTCNGRPQQYCPQIASQPVSGLQRLVRRLQLSAVYWHALIGFWLRSSGVCYVPRTTS